MVDRRRIGVAGLLASGLVIVIGITDPSIAGMLADLFSALGVQLVIPLPNLGDVALMISVEGWVGRFARFLAATFIILAVFNLGSRVTNRIRSE